MVGQEKKGSVKENPGAGPLIRERKAHSDMEALFNALYAVLAAFGLIIVVGGFLVWKWLKDLL